MKHYVICHMNASIDGRILGSRWRPAENRMPGLFERLHAQLGGGSWLIGRVTGSEYAKAEAYPDHTDQTYPREPWFARRDAIAYGVVLDAQGKIAWGRSDIGGDPIVVMLTERVSNAHPGGPSPGWPLLHLRRRAGARSGVGAGDPEPRAGARTFAARRWRRLERGLSTGRPDRVGMGGRLAIDGFGHHEAPAIVRVSQPAFGVLNARLTAHRNKQGIVEFLRPGDVVTPDHRRFGRFSGHLAITLISESGQKSLVGRLARQMVIKVFEAHRLGRRQYRQMVDLVHAGRSPEGLARVVCVRDTDLLPVAAPAP
jgi:hypothetical protein